MILPASAAFDLSRRSKNGVVDNHRRRIILQNAKQRREVHQMLGEVSPHSISPRE
jgi:hypothetical protein